MDPFAKYDGLKPETSEGGQRRRRLDVLGRVQGVGFRPFVFRLAGELGLHGFVGNDGQGVFVEVEGSIEKLDALSSRLKKELPPLARIASLLVRDIPPLGEEGFRIMTSAKSLQPNAEITPDMAACEDCLKELFDPVDRRYRYPFITCTNCGPRYSIIQTVPYDRPGTTMARFEMCARCSAEYESPVDRRFHAQPNACPECGPRVRLLDGTGNALDGDPVRTCADLLSAGKIVAMKGLGGFHLACRADSDMAVETLRRRKGREARPFAMMVGSLEEAEAITHLDAHAAGVLTGPARPIVLVQRREKAGISDLVAPSSPCLGIMLPYTPLHALLFAERPGPLVMTSGNPTAEPLCHENDEALERLSGMADAFLLHDRDIERPIDDSVVLVAPLPDRSSRPDGHETKSGYLVPLRRARGYVPEPIALSTPSPVPVLAVGGELKSSVCLLSGRRAVLSEHLGELTNPAAYRNFVRAIERFKKLLEVEPELVACDMHPDYAATRFARTLGLKVVEVQHHHAHVVSCMVDNGIDGPVIGVSCDGTGYGTDGTVWGCEVLVCEAHSFTRFAHLDTFPLPGGDAAARDTWRPAAGLLSSTFGESWRAAAGDCFSAVDPEAATLVERRLKSKAPIPMTSSLGRLFDGVAFLLGLCPHNRFEAEAPMTLEAAAWKGAQDVSPLPYTLIEQGEDRPVRIDFRPMIRALLDGLEGGSRVVDLAKAFHLTLASALSGCVVLSAARTGIDRVALSGGCFANRLLLREVLSKLGETNMEILLHGQVPPGDGGIALGQAVAAAMQQTRRLD